MKIKIYCQSFVLPYLESIGITEDFQFHNQNQYTDFLTKAFQDLSPQNITKTQRYQIYAKKIMKRKNIRSTFNSPITIDIDPQFINPNITDQIETIFIVQYDFNKLIRNHIYDQFYQHMIDQYILQNIKIYEVISSFYKVFYLDEDTLSSENLRYHWRITKPYSAGEREIFRHQLLSTQHLSNPTAQSN